MRTKIVSIFLISAQTCLIFVCLNLLLITYAADKFDLNQYRNDIEQGIVATYYSQFDGKEVEFNITKKELRAAPHWNANDSANPTLSAQKAIIPAKQELERLTSETNNWCLHSINMVQIGSAADKTKPWIYLVEYISVKNKRDRISIPVLMDGKAIQANSPKR